MAERFRGSDLSIIGILMVFVLLSFTASRQESVTIDEFRHLSTGVHYWQSGDYTFDAATPPLWKMTMSLPAYLAGAKMVQSRQLPEIAAGWEPWFVATGFMRDNGAAYHGYLQSARLVNILAAALCLLVLYRRCRKNYGGTAALAGTAFLAFSPTFLAHSHYATTDIIATLTMMVTVFLLIDYLKSPRLSRLAAAAFVFSLSLLCKFSALLLLPLLVVVPLAAIVQRTRGDCAAAKLRSLAAAAAVVTIVPLLTVSCFYGFRGTGSPLTQMHLESRSLVALQSGPRGDLPLPLPRPFVEGFDRQKYDSDNSEFPAFFLGRWSAEGFRWYYPVAFCLKETVPFLLVLAGSLWSVAAGIGRNRDRRDLLLLCFVPVTLFLVLMFMNRLNVGVRYLLPAYPFFCCFISRLFAVTQWRSVARLAFGGLFVLHSLSLARVAPYYTSYFNELCGGPEKGYRYLIDSNIDWGQDLIHLQQYMTVHAIDRVQLAYFGHGLPELYGIDYEPLAGSPKPGYVAISVSLLQGHPYLLTYTDPPQIADFDRFGFMRRLQPVGRAGYSILIYKIGQKVS